MIVSLLVACDDATGSGAGGASASSGSVGSTQASTGQASSGQGTTGATSSGATSSASTGTGMGCPLLVDTFDGAALSPCWTALNGPGSASPLFSVALASGALHLVATNGASGVWYQGSTKSLLYQTVAADHFKVTTTVHPRKRTNANAAPTNPLHVGGLMVRDPASNGGATESYVFIMAGSNEQAQPGVEVKSTTNGVSLFSEPVWADPLAADLRVCRLGSDFYLYKRVVGSGAWQLADHQGEAKPIARPDLPMTVQVGLALNFNGPDNDLDVAFDAVDLGPSPATAADCTSD
ncbi:MAG: hypothetical protein U0414_26575 [Polyangiaceae bacterium]